MSIIDELIIDRTQADVDRQLYLASLWDPIRKIFYGNKQNADEWLTGTKGTYGAGDLNRVGQAILYVADRLNAAGYAVEVSPRTDFTSDDWITPSYATKLLSELRQLRNQFAQMAGTPQVPADMEQMTFNEANDIEKILVAADQLLRNIMAAWFYSGDIYSGEV